MPIDKPESLTLTPARAVEGKAPLPGVLQVATRSGSAAIDPLLAGVTVDKVYLDGQG